jgi:hypothetical protein
MSQRRTGAAPGEATVKEAVPVESLSIDGPEDETEPLTVEERYQTEKHHLRLKHWRESPFAVGLTEHSWMAERHRPSESSRAYGDDELQPDSTGGCLCLSAQVCPVFGAGRVGNMAVLKSSHEWVEEVTEDEETGEKTSHRYSRPTLQVVMGPYWPMLLCVTYPLILGVSGWTFIAGILPGGKPAIVVFAWLVCTVGLIVALAMTGCRDPGIMHRHRNPPPQCEETWRWTDQAQSYRPRGAYFDVDTGVIVEEFDHTYVAVCLCASERVDMEDTHRPSFFSYRCPWTGTAIGKRNMLSFQFFVCFVFVCMIIDIFILTGAL